MTGTDAPTHKLIELDSLRGLMALWVYVTHVAFIVGFRPSGIAGLVVNGSMAVSVFMILSGFAIATSLLNRPSTYPHYLARRFFRIYPIYSVGLILGIATSALYPALLSLSPGIDPGDLARVASRTAGESTHFWAHLAAHATLLHGAIPDAWLYGSALAFNGPAWSLSLEAQFYVAAPLLIALLARPASRPVLLALLALLAFVGRPLFGDVFPQVPSFLLLALPYFILGIMTAIHIGTLAARPDVTLAVGLTLVAVAFHAGENLVAIPIAIWVGAICVSIVPQWRVFRSARAVLRWRPLLTMGEISYGFYILHLPILIGWGWALQAHGVSPGESLFLPLLLLTVPITLVLAHGSYRWFERPINDWARRRFRAQSPLPVAPLAPALPGQA